MPWRSLKHAYFISISENCYTKREVGYVYSTITSPVLTFSGFFFLDKRKTAVYDHCRVGSEIIKSGRKTMTCVWGHLVLVTVVHAIWSSSCSELHSKVSIGVIKNIWTPDTCFWVLGFFPPSSLKCWLGVSCFFVSSEGLWQLGTTQDS